jgi:CRISPR-associated exonuclease Cas4
MSGDEGSMFLESDLLPISGLQHLLYCERQCALIHLENQWSENRFTAEGAVLHRAAHSGRSETRRNTRCSRSLPVHSLTLGLYGIADVVRIERGREIVPVEYKRGRPKRNACDRVQLCAQALCLEEMLDREIPHGDLFYGQTRRLTRVEFDANLRELTRSAAARFHALIRSAQTPAAEPGPKCRHCSLQTLCMPELANRSNRVRSYIDAAVAVVRDDS